MHLPTSTFERPHRLDDLLACLAAGDRTVMCGGTDLIPDRRLRPRAEMVVDITGVSELRGIARTPEGWRIGSVTTWREIAEARLPPGFDGLRQAARQIGGVQIQNMGTIGGNLCTASPAADGLPALLTLDARVELRSVAGQRTLPVREFVAGYRRTMLRPGEMLTAIVVPAPDPHTRGTFVKLGSRTHLVISIAMVAAEIAWDDGCIMEARVAVGACSPVARRLRKLESELPGTVCSEAAVRQVVDAADLAELDPIGDIRGSAPYRLTVVSQLITDAVLASAVAA